MAANSKREQIILADIAIVKAMAGIKTVKRTLQSYSDLQNFAGPQLPAVAVVGRLPVPENKFSSRSGQVDQCISRLRVDLYSYALANEDMDSLISSLMDDLWVELYKDPTRNNLVMNTYLEVNEEIEFWPPFIAFQISCIHQYKHSTEGI
jgi:hypothetical protein